MGIVAAIQAAGSAIAESARAASAWMARQLRTADQQVGANLQELENLRAENKKLRADLAATQAPKTDQQVDDEARDLARPGS
jgi:hypothetical protein